MRLYYFDALAVNISMLSLFSFSLILPTSLQFTQALLRKSITSDRSPHPAHQARKQ